MTHNAGVIHEITLRDEEVCDISLATFDVFDKEGTKTFQAGERPVTLGQACCLFACLAGQAAESNAYSPPMYSPPLSRPIRPAHKPGRKKR